MNEQMSIFDWMPTVQTEPNIGDYVESHGAIICHIMRPEYIGKKVVYDCSTQSHKWYRVGVLENYIPYENHMRSIINVGNKQRILLTHYPGIEIYECLSWKAYPDRMKAIGRKAIT